MNDGYYYEFEGKTNPNDPIRMDGTVQYTPCKCTINFVKSTKIGDLIEKCPEGHVCCPSCHAHVDGSIFKSGGIRSEMSGLYGHIF